MFWHLLLYLKMMCIIQQSGKKTIIEAEKWQIRDQNFYFQQTQKSEILPDFGQQNLESTLAFHNNKKLPQLSIINRKKCA
jgi:hypothetical protein